MTQERGWLGFGRGGEAPRVLMWIPLRYGMAVAMNRAWPSDPIHESSSSTRQSLSRSLFLSRGHRELPLSVETLTFFSLIPIWGLPKEVCTHFPHAMTMDTELEEDTRGLGEAPSRPGLHHRGPSLPPSHLWAPGTAPLLPPPFHPQVFSVTVSVKQALCRQGLQPTQRIRRRTGGQSVVVLKTNLVCFSSNTYISQLWLIHSSKSKSSSILHPFLTVQTGTPPLLLPSPS